jgi:transcriptional regulator GlxA family with amidase domain
MVLGNFARFFTQEIGKTPGKHIEGLRLEAAQPQLELTPATFEEVAMSSLDGSAVLRAKIENHSEAGDANIRSRNGKVA